MLWRCADTIRQKQGFSMKKTLAILGLSMLASAAAAQGAHAVRGYTRADGTYVAPHMQSNPNGTKLDNYSTLGNVNPYTGQPGTVNPYAQTQSNPTGSPYNQTPSNSGWPR